VPLPLVTVVVVTWQQRELVLDCLESVAAQTLACRVLVVDNASTDGTAEAVRSRFPEAELVVLPENCGFAGGVDEAVRRVTTRFVALLNNDAVADPGWLAASVRALEDPTVAAVTSKLLLAGRGGTVNNVGVVLLDTGYGADRGLGEPDDGRFDQAVEVFGFSGGAAVLRTLAVRAVGGFASDWFMYYEDTDLSWRLRLAGWRIVYEPGAVVRHRHAASSDPASSFFAFHNERNRLLMLLRDAPLSALLRGTLRFGLTTGSLAVTRLRGRPVPPDPVFDTRLRVRVLQDAIGRGPATVRRRWRGPRTRRRAEVLREWAGIDSRPIDRDG
jgi:GT2 family glycosyltransferase